MNDDPDQKSLPSLDDVMSRIARVVQIFLPYLTVITVLWLGAFLANIFGILAADFVRANCQHAWSCASTIAKTHQIVFLIGTWMTFLYVYIQVTKGVIDPSPSMKLWIEAAKRSISLVFFTLIIARLVETLWPALVVLLVLTSLFLIPLKKKPIDGPARPT